MKGASVDELVAHCEAVAARDAAGRLLPADRRRRHRAAGGLLAPLCRHRQRHRDQDGALRPLPHARRGARRGRGRRRGPRHAVHRQRRPHRARPAGALRRAARRRRGHACASAAACSATGACGRSARSSSSSASTPPSQPGSVDADAAGAGLARHRLQQRLLRRRPRLCRLHPRLPRGAAPPGPAAGHLVPGPERDAVAGPGGRDRPRLPRACRPVRRRLRRANLARWLD